MGWDAEVKGDAEREERGREGRRPEEMVRGASKGLFECEAVNQGPGAEYRVPH